MSQTWEASHFKDPNDVMDYGLDWTDWLAKAPTPGDSIATSEWIAPAGITVDSEGLSGARTVVWLSGGTDEAEYIITNRIVTAQGRQRDRSLRIVMRQS